MSIKTLWCWGRGKTLSVLNRSEYLKDKELVPIAGLETAFDVPGLFKFANTCWVYSDSFVFYLPTCWTYEFFCLDYRGEINLGVLWSKSANGIESWSSDNRPAFYVLYLGYLLRSDWTISWVSLLRFSIAGLFTGNVFFLLFDT